MEDFTQLTHMLVRGNRFGEIHNLNLVEACHSNIFALMFNSNLFNSNLLKRNCKKQELQE